MGGRHVRSRCCDGSGHANGVHVSTAIRDLGCLANTFPNARLHMEFHGRGRRHSHNLVQLLGGAAPRSGFRVLRTHMVGRGWLLVPQTLHTSTTLEAPAACFPSRSCCTRRARFPSLRAPRLPFKILDMECTDCIRFDLCDEVFVRSSLSLADAAAASRDVFPVLSHRSLATNAVSIRRKASLRVQTHKMRRSASTVLLKAIDDTMTRMAANAYSPVVSTSLGSRPCWSSTQRSDATRQELSAGAMYSQPEVRLQNHP